MLHSYLTRPGNPPHLLLAALNDIGNYELGIEQRTLLALSVWKAQCIGFCLVGEHTGHDCESTDWMAYKLELCHSNAMTIVVAAVEPFLYPRVPYKIDSSVATRQDAGNLGWMIAEAF